MKREEKYRVKCSLSGWNEQTDSPLLARIIARESCELHMCTLSVDLWKVGETGGKFSSFHQGSVSSFDGFFLGERVLFSGICFITTTDLTKVKLERRVKILSFCSSRIRSNA